MVRLENGLDRKNVVYFTLYGGLGRKVENKQRISKDEKCCNSGTVIEHEYGSYVTVQDHPLDLGRFSNRSLKVTKINLVFMTY